jgi:transcriptional regulator with GAF, ATPase, and Fis domain
VPAEIRFGKDGRRAGASDRTFPDLKAEAERRILIEALERNGWHVSRTASRTGLADHASLLKIMRRLNIRRAGAGSV